MRALRAAVVVVTGAVLGTGSYLILFDVEGPDRIMYAALLALFTFVGVWIYRELGRLDPSPGPCRDCP